MWSQAANAMRPSLARVTVVNLGPPKTLTVTALQGASTFDARYMRSYVPLVGDVVLVMQNAAQALVIGPVA